MEAMTNLADCAVPSSLVKEMGQQEYQARLLQLQAKVSACGHALQRGGNMLFGVCQVKP